MAPSSCFEMIVCDTGVGRELDCCVKGGILCSWVVTSPERQYVSAELQSISPRWNRYMFVSRKLAVGRAFPEPGLVSRELQETDQT